MNKFKKGDKVIVVKGRDKGKKGEILAVFKDQHKVIVDKVNIAKKHMKASQKSSGGIIEVPSKIAWSNIMVLCSKTDKPSRVGIKEVDGKRVRFAKVSGELLK